MNIIDKITKKIREMVKELKKPTNIELSRDDFGELSTYVQADRFSNCIGDDFTAPLINGKVLTLLGLEIRINRNLKPGEFQLKYYV